MSTQEKVKVCGVKKKAGFLYFIDKDGDVSNAVLARGTKKGGKAKKVLKAGISKEDGYLYFLDKNGDISRVVRKNSGIADKNAKKASAKKTPAAKKTAVKKAAAAKKKK